MTVDQLVAHLSDCRRRILELQHEHAVLHDTVIPVRRENKRLRRRINLLLRSREEWKTKAVSRTREIEGLRREVRRLKHYGNLPKIPASEVPPVIYVSEDDLDRILGMPPRP